MKNQNAGKSRLFFIEFLIVLFFFLIVSTICLRLFAKAHQITQNANALAHAQSAAASVAEVLSDGRGTAEEVATYFPDAVVNTDASMDSDAYTLTIPYDRDFIPCSSGQQPCYTLTAAVILLGNEKTANITVHDARQNEIYSLSVSFHTPITREEALS